MRDGQRNIVTTQLNASELQTLAQQNRGRYRTLTNNSSDIKYLMDLPAPEKQETQTVDREFDSWYDRGHWLVLLLLPALLYCFRRGVLLGLFVLPLLGLTPEKSYALDWNDLWKNKNQQAYEQLQQQKAAEAASNFNDPAWKASAQYRAGNYEEAAQNFSQLDTADGHYNRGNALAKAGKLPEALKAYDQALKIQPDMADAKKNRKLVEDLIKQQQQNQQNQDQNSDQNNEDKNKDEQNQDKQQGQQDKNNQEQNNQDQAGEDQQNQDQNQQDGNSQNQGENSEDASQQDAPQQDQKQQEQDQQKLDMKDQAQKDQAKEQEQEQQDQTDAQQQPDQPDEENAAQAGQAKEEESQEDAEQQPADVMQDDGLTNEERQAMEQWLRRVPDDPGGLLRNKFNYEHYKRNQDILNGEWSAPDNGAENRW